MTTTPASSALCPECGGARPHGSPAGLCPHCLLRLTVGADSAPGATRLVLGDYEIIEELARGGMGIVYRARQRRLRREVAVKVLRGGEFAGREAQRRFRAEAAAVAKLQHPGIVAIHDVGEADGVLWFAMELVPGKNLAEHTREHPLAARAAAECVRRVAEAVQHAHAQGVLHRDLKPSNILLGADEQPRITDFGFARHTHSDAAGEASGEITRTGQMLGSPGYAAPEQALGGTADARTDVYGLGAVLYHLLTGRPPFQGPTVDSILLQLRENDPLPPRQLNPTVPRELETICLRCLHRDSTHRYATALEVAEDLARFLEGVPVHARPAAPAEKFWRWCQRRPAIAALTGLLLLAVTVGGVSVFRQMRRAQTAEGQARVAEADALAEARTARAAAYRSNVRMAAHELPRGRSPGFELIAADEAGTRSLRGWEWNYLRTLAPQGELLMTDPKGREIYSAQFSPDGLHFAAASSRGEIWVWETGSRKLLRTIQAHVRGIGGIAWHPDSRRLASASGDRTVKLWDALDGKELQKLPHFESTPWVLTWHPDGTQLGVGGHPREFSVWEMETGKKVAAWPMPSGTDKASWNPSGDSIALRRSGDETALRLLDAQHAPTQQVVKATEIPSAFAWHPDGRRLAIATRQGQVRIVDPKASGPDEWERQTGLGTIYSLAFSRDGRRLLAGSADGLLQIWDWPRNELLQTITAHQTAVERISSAADLILTCGHDGTVRLWDLPERASGPRTLDAGGAVRSLQWSADGTLQAVVLNRRGANWQASFPQWPATSTNRILSGTVTGALNSVGAWSRDGTRLATFDARGQLEIRTAATGEMLRRIKTARPGWDVSWNHAGDRCAVFAADVKSTMLCDPTEGTLGPALAACPALAFPFEDATACAWSPDGRQLLMSGMKTIYDTDTGRALLTWPDYDTVWDTHPGFVMTWDWHSDGQRVALGTHTGMVEIRAATDGRVIRSRRIHSGLVHGVRRHPTEPRLATASRDGTVKILDAETLEELLTLPNHGGDVRAVAWSRDGKTLASGGADGRILLWDTRSVKP